MRIPAILLGMLLCASASSQAPFPSYNGDRSKMAHDYCAAITFMLSIEVARPGSTVEGLEAVQEALIGLAYKHALRGEEGEMAHYVLHILVDLVFEGALTGEELFMIYDGTCKSIAEEAGI